MAQKRKGIVACQHVTPAGTVVVALLVKRKGPTRITLTTNDRATFDFFASGIVTNVTFSKRP